MRLTRKIIALMIVLLLAVSLLSCASSDEYENVKSYTEAFINALLADDFDAAYAIVNDSVSEQELAQAYEGMKSYIAGTTTYTLTQTGWRSNFNLFGGASITAVYTMETNESTYEVTVTAKKGEQGLISFNISRKSTSGSGSSGVIEA